MADRDLIDLYSGRILELAAHIPLTKRLDTPQATVKKRSPLCGSTVTVDLNVKDGRISAYGQDVKACALGQAAASALAGSVVGATLAQLRGTRAAMGEMLTQQGDGPNAPFEAMRVLRPARDFKNRHASILLALDATIEAMEMIEQNALDCADAPLRSQ